MWDDAFRICKQYAPNMLPDLQEAFDASEVESSQSMNNRDAEKILTKAQEYERFGQNAKAVELYLQLNPSNTQDQTVLVNYWKRATELAVKFLDKVEAKSVVSRVCPHLTSMGRFLEAANLCVEAGMVNDGLEILMTGGHFEEAEGMAAEMGAE